MKIVTVNVPESYIEAIKKLVGEDGLYPSRSELIRCAVRDFLLREFKSVHKMSKYTLEEQGFEDFDDKNFVKIPIESKGDGDEPITELRTFKILREA
ncbi:MAG: ribbon-helix-helix protein, CopG family [Candidatus Lokiarchaeota archaeon]|nr:ribbon-helix-helix protein, CopG family [Candidatus Lokiarchaeota archaeon]